MQLLVDEHEIIGWPSDRKFSLLFETTLSTNPDQFLCRQLFREVPAIVLTSLEWLNEWTQPQLSSAELQSLFDKQNKQTVDPMANHVLHRLCLPRIPLFYGNPTVQTIRLSSNKGKSDDDFILEKKKDQFRKLDLMPNKQPPRVARKTHFGQVLIE